jgi:hypothetical protein
MLVARRRLFLRPVYSKYVPSTTSIGHVHSARSRLITGLTPRNNTPPPITISHAKHIAHTKDDGDDRAYKPAGNTGTPTVQVSPRRNITVQLVTETRPSRGRTTRISRYAKENLYEKERLKNGGWRERLQSFEQLDFESDLTGPLPTDGSMRLVDYDTLQKETEIWETLLTFRQRVYGSEGTATIWARLSSLGYTQLPPIHSSEKLMQGFMEAGFENRPLLYDFCKFLFRSYRLTGLVPQDQFAVYTSIILHILRTDPEEAPSYHDMLQHFPPTRKQLCDLVVNASKETFQPTKPRMVETLSKFCFNLSTFTGMYDLIIPALCEDGQFDAAEEWHYALVRLDDLPTNALSVEALFGHIQASGKPDQIKKIMRKIGHRLQDTSAAPTVAVAMQKHEVHQMVSLLERKFPLYSPHQTMFSEEFCARLLATRFFSIPAIINGFSMLGIQQIGPSCVREILLRVADRDECETGKVQETIDLLSKANILLDTSAFCRLVLKLVSEKNARVLYDLAVSDQHPDELENWRLQEDFLSRCQDANDSRQFEKTMAILLMESTENAYDTKYMNVLLRVALRKKDYSMTMRHLRDMRVRRLPVTTVSRTVIFHTVIPERVAVKGFHRLLPHSSQLDRYIHIMKYIMQGGTPVAPREWDDAMRSLLISGRLLEFEDLTIYLLKWYSDPVFQESQLQNRGGVKGTPMQREYSHWSQILRDIRIGEIVAFGWYHMARQHSTTPVSGVTLENRATKLAQHPTLWPLRFLVRLRDMGYPIKRRVVAEACKRRLWSMFSLGHRERKRNRYAANRRLGNAKDYIAAMEKVWGQDLFERRVPVGQMAAQSLYQANREYFRVTIMKWRNLERTGRVTYRRWTRHKHNTGAQKWSRTQLLRKLLLLEKFGICRRVGNDFVLTHKLPTATAVAAAPSATEKSTASA